MLDRENDVVHVVDCQLFKKEVVAVIASAIRSRGEWIPVCFPHDGFQNDRQSGVPMAHLFRDEHHVNMLGERATFESDGDGVEAGVAMVLDRFRSGRLKIRADLEPLWKELRSYYRRDGVIVKKNDHCLDALRYAVMMLRYAETKNDSRNRWQPIQYSNAGIVWASVYSCA